MRFKSTSAPPARFRIAATYPSGKVIRREADTVVEAWDWHAHFTKRGAEIDIVDTQEVSA